MKLTSRNVDFCNWFEKKEPFDMMANCNSCLSMHDRSCGYHAHEVVVKAVRESGLKNPGRYTLKDFRKHFPVFLRLRKKFASFYPKKGRVVA